jgi:hypothetical protein
MKNRFPRTLSTLILALMLGFPFNGQAADDAKSGVAAPETVCCTYQVKAGQEANFAALLSKSRTLYEKLGLVLPQPYLATKGSDGAGHVRFQEIFTWKTADIPDNAPPEVAALWGELNEACEARGGQPAIGIAIVHVVGTR